MNSSETKCQNNGGNSPDAFFVLATSDDEDGKSWHGGPALDERNGISCPDSFQAPDGVIDISYDRNRSADGEILLTLLNEEDIVAKQSHRGTSAQSLTLRNPEYRCPTTVSPNK